MHNPSPAPSGVPFRASRRAFLQTLGLGAAGMALAPLAGRGAAGRRPPNVILIMADDLSARDMGCYGNTETRTPQFDELARTGVMFRTCWATPICSPSRAQIMTGLYGFRTGWYHNELRSPQPLAQDHLTVGQAMREAGYATAVVGKWQLPGNEELHGFEESYMWLGGHPLARQLRDRFDGPIETEGHVLPGRPARYWHPAIVRQGELVPTGPDDYGPDLFVDYLNDFASRHRDRPFFVYFPMCLPHTTWDFELERNGYVAPPRLDGAGNRGEGKGEPTLRANVEYIDYLVGRIVRHLQSLGIRDDTVILFTSDNGASGYGKGIVNEERGSRVPLVVNGPGVVRPLGASDALVQFADILPTMLDLAGAPAAAAGLDGISFAPLLRGEPFAGRDWIFGYYATHRMLRDRRWLLDGAGRFFDCGDRRDEEDYRDVTASTDPEVVAARRRFDEILADLPGPSEELAQRWEERVAAQRAARQRRRAEQGRQ